LGSQLSFGGGIILTKAEIAANEPHGPACSYYDVKDLPPHVGPWNPRYVCYARAHGREPQAMLDYDRDRFPGGSMSGFVVWNGDKWKEFANKFHPKTPPELRQCYHGDEYDRWLAAESRPN